MAMEPPTGPTGSEPGDWQDAAGKLRAATGADRIILIAGLVFFVSSFLPWYGFGIAGLGSANISGWSSGGLAVIAILLGIAATAFAAVRVIGMKVELGTVPDGTIYLALGGGAFVFTLLRLITQSSLTKFGLYLALVSSGALAYGAFVKQRG